jgi:hypothetical protein
VLIGKDKRWSVLGRPKNENDATLTFLYNALIGLAFRGRDKGATLARVVDNRNVIANGAKTPCG